MAQRHAAAARQKAWLRLTLSLKYAILTRCHAFIVHKSDFITLCHDCLACKPYTVTVQNIMTT